MQLLCVRSMASRAELVGLIRPLLEDCPVPATGKILLVLCLYRSPEEPEAGLGVRGPK